MTETQPKRLSKTVTCKCGRTAYMTDDDLEFNNVRLKEQKEFRSAGQTFNLNLKYTCSLCGVILISRALKR